jgi:hypothetical protein
MKRKCGILAAMTIGLAIAIPTGLFANDIQRLIVDAGINLGLWHVQVELFNTPTNDPSQVTYATNTFNSIVEIRNRLIGPLANIDLQSVLDLISRYPAATDGQSAAHRASYVHGIYWLLRSRLSVLFLSTQGIYASPNCDSSFLDVGYYLGRGQMGAFANNEYVMSNARTMMLQAVRVGLDLALSCPCTFNVENAWGAIPIVNARTLADFERLVEPIRGTAAVASLIFPEGSPISLSSPPPSSPPPLPNPSASLLGTWRMGDGATVNFAQSGNMIIGTIQNLPSVYRSLGYREGMQYFTFLGGSQGVYSGQVIIRDSGGNFTWKNCRVTVSGNSATFNELFDGGRASYTATRI